MSKVNFRELRLEDKKKIFEWISDSGLRKMTGTRGIPTSQGHDIWFQNKLDDNTNELFIIENDGKSVGIIGTNAIDQLNRNAEIYLYIGERQQKGKGIATESVKIFVHFLTEKYMLHKVIARVFSYNQPSIGLFEKCGFVLEGRLKEQIYQPEENVFADLLWYSFYTE